ncbi:EF-hand calcium-binding domain-containing protein 1 [Elysia marginata]|uniref:EF-hand calcium-binding domain-containing protein 1 n=1 Tax=Elysia marginata TaxID=1093978 RepID=A0AAV4FBA5_9GAST|nr:EF-hand calcium-binding domain-containing protein 1 [Elysia marginata]
MGSEDHDYEDQVKELIDLVMVMTDQNNDGVITFEEFSEYVHHDILCIELLGSVLPRDCIISSFLPLIKEKPPHAVSLYFAHERHNSLQEPTMPPRRDKLYPVRLELP